MLHIPTSPTRSGFILRSASWFSKKDKSYCSPSVAWTVAARVAKTPQHCASPSSTMAHENRIHQLEDIANKVPHNEGKYQDLIAGEMSTSSSQNGITHLVPVPVTLKAQLGSPVKIRRFVNQIETDHGEQTALAIGAFATTLTTLSLSLMEWRGVTVTNVYIGNFFFVAGIQHSLSLFDRMSSR